MIELMLLKKLILIKQVYQKSNFFYEKMMNYQKNMMKFGKKLK